MKDGNPLQLPSDPSFGTLTLEDKSPIKREDILALVQSSGGKRFKVFLSYTKDIQNWLVNKEKASGDYKGGIAGFILNIDGKLQQNTILITSQTMVLLIFEPITEQDTLIMQAGQSYNINFS